MGGDHSKIVTKDVPYQEIKASSPIEMSRFCPPFRKFGKQQRVQNGRLLQMTIQIELPAPETISYTQQCFKDMEEAFSYKTKDIELQTVLFDDLYVDRKIYIAKYKEKQISLQIRPFSGFNTHTFNDILYELYMNQQIAQLNSPNLNTIIDSYAIITGLEVEGEQFPNSEVIQIQQIATNLSEIIKYRRQNKWFWTVNEFNVLANDLCNAVKTLHENNISHNDIRPFNVYYSIEKSGYQLGGFSNAIKQVSEGKNNMFRSSMFFGAPQLEVGSEIDLQQADIYSLGMTLLCAFYLCQPVDRKAASPYNRKYEDKYKLMNIIREMLMPIERRKNLEIIMSTLEPGKPSPKIKSLIQSLRYKNTPKDRKLVETKRALSQGYQRLGLWNQWKNNLYDAYELEENTLDEYKKASSLAELARIQSCRGDMQNANQYAKKSSKIFRNLGYAAYDQGNVNEAISLFSKAVQSSKYFQNENDIDAAKNLQGLALAHSQKGDYEVAKPLISQSTSIVLKINGRDSMDYCTTRISEAQIETDFGEFDSAAQILNDCLAISQSRAKVNQDLGLQLKAQVLHDFGRNLMMKSSYVEEPERSQSLQKSENSINEALQLNERIPNNHIRLSKNVETFGEIQMRKGNYITARNNFRKAQSIRQTYLKEQNREGTMQKDKADSLCQIASCETQLGEYQQALKTYNEALQIYRTIYGSDHNKLSAIAIGNMSKIYYKLNEKVRARSCLQLATEIIEDVSGVQDGDYEHFKYMESTLEE